MGRSIARKPAKKKISVTPDPDLLAWVMEHTGPGKRFASITHAVEIGWATLREQEEGAKKRS